MKKALSIIVLFTALALGATFLHPLFASAAFNANDLIDDSVFNNTNTMNASAIDSFLNQFPNSCLSTNKGFKAPDVIGYSPSPPGPADTGRYYYGGAVSARTLIYHASQVYGLNPRVILATLEKEEGLVSGSGYPGNPACSNLRYTAAMGYLCTDTVTPHDYSGWELYSLNGTQVTSVSGTCTESASVAGFSRQIIVATWQMKFDQQRSEGNVGWNVQRTNYPNPGNTWDNSDDPQSCYSHKMTQGYYQACPSGPFATFDGLYPIDGTTVHMDTGPTAALYNYTPHFPGNQNFVTIFQNWFGSPVGELLRTSTNAQIYIVNSDTGYKYPTNSANVMNDFSALGVRTVDDSYLSQFTVGQAVGNMVQGPDTSLYLVNASIKLPFPGGSCATYVTDYGFSCAAGQFVPLMIGQISKLSSGPGITKLAKSNTDSTIYYMAGGVKRPITSLDDLQGLHLNQGTNTFNAPFINSFPTWYPIFKPGSLIKYSSSAAIYEVADANNAFQIGSFIYPQEMGLSTGYRIISGGFSPGPVVENKLLCSSNNYVSTNGNTYQVSPAMMTAYGWTNGQFLAGDNICANLKISAQGLSDFIRTSDGSIYRVSSGHKTAYTRYDDYVTACNAVAGGCTVTQVSNFFANSIL